MAFYLLDTGILLGYIRGAAFAEYIEAKYGVSQPPNIACVSAVTVGEIRSLALQLGWGNNKMQKLKEILKKVPSVEIGQQAILEKYAEIDAYSQGKHPSLKLPSGVTSRNMGKNDVWIAATGSVLKATLITTDHDFDHLHDVFLNVIWIDQKMTKEDANT